jgi:hypothetical protein
MDYFFPVTKTNKKYPVIQPRQRFTTCGQWTNIYIMMNSSIARSPVLLPSSYLYFWYIENFNLGKIVYMSVVSTN